MAFSTSIPKKVDSSVETNELRVQGKLEISHKSIQIPVQLSNSIVNPFYIDSSLRTSSISWETARKLNATSHPRLIGQTGQFPNGQTCYFTEIDFSLLGIQFPFVVCIQDREVLGNDVLVNLNLKLEFENFQFSIDRKIRNPTNSAFPLFSFDKALEAIDLKRSNLIPITDLPPISELISKDQVFAFDFQSDSYKPRDIKEGFVNLGFSK